VLHLAVRQWKKTAKQGSKTSLRHYQIECCHSGASKQCCQRATKAIAQQFEGRTSCVMRFFRICYILPNQ